MSRMTIWCGGGVFFSGSYPPPWPAVVHFLRVAVVWFVGAAYRAAALRAWKAVMNSR
jgi:hypothetical protein